MDNTELQISLRYFRNNNGNCTEGLVSSDAHAVFILQEEESCSTESQTVPSEV